MDTHAPPSAPTPVEPPAPPTAPIAPTTPPAPGPTTTTKPTTQRHQPKINRETLIVIALVVTTAELALVAALGSWTRWLIIHGAICVIALIVFLAKSGRARRRATGTGNGRGTSGRGRCLGGLLGRLGRGAGGHGRSTGTGGRGRGLGGLLGRRGHGAGANAHAPGSHGRGLGGLLGRRGHGAGTGSGLSGRGHGAGGHGRGAGTGGRGLGSLFGGTNGGTGSGRGHGAGTDSRGRGLGSLFGGRGHDKDDTDQSELLSRIAQEFKKGWDKGGSEDEDDTKNNDAPDEDNEDDAPDEDNEEPAGQNNRNTPANTNRGTRKMVKTQGTPSLQAWGRCLPSIEQALLEKQTELRRVEADLEEITQAVVRLRDQGEQELPASPKLVALLEDVQASLSKMPKTSEAIGHVARNANALGPMYRIEHMGDEDRLAGMRGGVEREKRSDVSEAQKDT